MPATSSSTCPICSAPARPHVTKSAFDIAWNILACTRCGHGFVLNRPTLTQLNSFYQQQPAQLGHDAPAAHPPRAARELAKHIAALTPLRGRSLDVGCGSGDFSIALQSAGFTPTLTDWSPAVLDLARFFPGGRVYQCAFEDLPDAGPYAAILMSQVLEHALDPVAWLTRCRDLLQPRGVLAVASPNFAGLYRLLGSRDPFLIPPFHLNYFSPASLRLALERAGLHTARIDSISDLDTPPTTPTLRRAAFGLATLALRPLEFTARGIILRGFARRPSVATEEAS